MQSADHDGIDHADFSFEELAYAWEDCRRTKRNTTSALLFEADLERNLRRLYDDLQEGTYQPGRSICFVVTRPKPREVWAADFRDRVVHHLLYRKIGPRFERAFIADSCACLKGRGTLYAANRLEAKVRSITRNWTREARYIKCDFSNFFVSIDKTVLRGLLARRIHEPWWLDLADRILFHDPRQDVEIHSPPSKLALIPAHKSLFNQPAHLGLPIGNLSSQFFANVYLNELDQFVKHQVKARHYVRYVDDFVLLHESAQWLNAAKEQIDAFVLERLNIRLNESKTIRQPVARGIDFVGHVIAPHHHTLRRRTFNEALTRVATISAECLFATGNSYLGLMGQVQKGHQDAIRLANVIRRRGHTISAKLTKMYRKPIVIAQQGRSHAL